ncbi:MAG: hypothetical protein ACXV45_08715 [Halobacteriota archaeon]
MMRKIIVAIVVIAIASLSVAGCTSPMSTPSPSPSQATSTAQAQQNTSHNPTLARYITALEQVARENFTVNAWNVSWNNSTAVEYQYTAQNKTTNATVNQKVEVMYFTSTDDATSYFASLNKTGYALVRTVYPSDGAYVRATGSVPTIYYAYQRATGELLQGITVDRIAQLDNIVWVSTSTLV